jgi:hypothetical protein
MSYKIELNDEQVDKLLVEALVASYHSESYNLQEIKARKAKDGFLPIHELQNREDSKKIRKQLKAVIRYYTTKSEFDALGI